MGGGLKSLFSEERKKKKVPPPRLKGIEVEVKYRKTDTFSFPPHLETERLFQNSTSFFCPIELDRVIFFFFFWSSHILELFVDFPSLSIVWSEGRSQCCLPASVSPIYTRSGCFARGCAQ